MRAKLAVSSAQAWCGSLFLVFGSLAVAASGQTTGEWSQYAGMGSQKYSPLDQIDASNVARLEIAWRLPSLDHGAAEADSRLRPSRIFESTPLLVDGRLLLVSGVGIASAHDPETGELLWSSNPYEGADGEEPSRRNMGFGIIRGSSSQRVGDQTFLTYTANGRLRSLDVATGRGRSGFGDGGQVDLRVGSTETEGFFWTSPPLLCRGVWVIGNSTTDQSQRRRAPKGQIRGYDSASGEPSGPSTSFRRAAMWVRRAGSRALKCRRGRRTSGPG